MTLMVDGWCAGCHKPLGFRVAWHSADFVWHRKCWKAHEVYTPPPRPQDRPLTLGTLADVGNGRHRQRRKLWLRQDKTCPWCGLPITPAEYASAALTDRDHVVPRSHGGQGLLHNLQLLHRQCNVEKGDSCPGGCGYGRCAGLVTQLTPPQAMLRPNRRSRVSRPTTACRDRAARGRHRP